MNSVKSLLFRNALPVDEALPALREALSGGRAAVLVAPPGAGKTTRVPLALLDQQWVTGKILVLEPRRLAARAAAARMAWLLGEKIGETIGLRVRFDSRVSARTRIEVMTEGVFTRAILDSPELAGASAVLFDEFHERSLDADLGLALALDAQRGLREDLRLVAMSATLDGARVAKLLSDAPVIESQGRAFPVETRYLGRDARSPIERQMADAVEAALRDEKGSLLVFLPGAGEIRRTANLIEDRLRGPAVDVVPLYGALDADQQDRAIAPAGAGKRKVVLATSIAETSLTIEGVRVVIDSGLARVPRFEPAVGMTRLETVRVSRASADQRRGRAGRTEAGVCYRLWTEPETQSLAPFATPEILAADLTGLVLDLAIWGVTDPTGLGWLDPPPAAALAEAKALLIELGALDRAGRVTEHGKRLARFPLHPRLAAMIVAAAEEDEALLASEIAAVVSERGLGGDDPDLGHRLAEFRRDRSRRVEEARWLARQWAETAGGKSRPGEASKAGAFLALAYPDRIAKARPGRRGEFLLANGRGAAIDPAQALAREEFLAVAELAGTAAVGRILLAARLDETEIEARFTGSISEAVEVSFDDKAMAVRARAVRKLEALTLVEQPRPVAPTEETAHVLADGVIRSGFGRLPWEASRQWLDRVRFMRRLEGEPWPELSEDALKTRAADWLLPALYGKTSLAEIAPNDLGRALRGLLPRELERRLQHEAPPFFRAPTGSELPIDYAPEDGPMLAVRVQELFGLDRHPTVAAGRMPLTLELLSPARRPIQTTRNLPGFWRGSWAEVKREMRGRYPKHPWPDDPSAAAPTRRAKPRK